MRLRRRKPIEIPAPDLTDTQIIRTAFLLRDRPVIRFLVRGGYAISPHDRDWHYISARAVAQLHQVDLRECILVDDPWLHEDRRGHRGRDALIGYSQEYLDTLLKLRPFDHHYSPVTPAERRQYPIGGPR